MHLATFSQTVAKGPNNFLSLSAVYPGVFRGAVKHIVPPSAGLRS